MESTINDIFPDEITIVTADTMNSGGSRYTNQFVWQVIDHLGEMSSKAQGLNKVITTAEKLYKSEHILYILKDPNGDSGRGEAIGLLKIGRKHLFIFNPHTQSMQECEPLCVLDFFVLTDRQRHGYGKKLFDYMLEEQNVSPHLIAIDGPSPKMEKFLIKNYAFDPILKQNNNFAVSLQFFKYSKADVNSCEVKTPISSPVGRYSAYRPQSSIANVIHGTGRWCDKV